MKRRSFLGTLAALFAAPAAANLQRHDAIPFVETERGALVPTADGGGYIVGEAPMTATEVLLLTGVIEVRCAFGLHCAMYHIDARNTLAVYDRDRCVAIRRALDAAHCYRERAA